MKILLEIPDGVLQESLQTAHNLNVKFEEYAKDAFNEYNEKWESREARAKEDLDDYPDVRGFVDNIEVGDLIIKTDEKPVYMVEDIYPPSGSLKEIRVKGKDGKIKIIPKEDFPQYMIVPF